MKIAKLLLAFMVLSLSLNFISCSKDDDKTENNSIVGTWKFDTAVVEELQTTNSKYDAEIKESLLKYIKEEQKDTRFTFESNGIVTFYFDDDEEETDLYTFGNGRLTFDDEGDPSYVEASIVGGKLFIMNEMGTYYKEYNFSESLNAAFKNGDVELKKVVLKESYKRQ